MTKVSIIVPVYNVEKYLDRCMQSLLNQTLKDIEIIIVDDGSPDNCPAMCDEYARQDSRVKVIHKKNEGLGFARNSGLKIATGEYIAFVDSDDFVKTIMYEELYIEAKQNELDVLFCNFYRHDKSGNVKEVREIKKNEFYAGKEKIFRFLLNMIGTEPSYSDDRKYSMSVWHGIYANKIIQNFSITFPSEREMVSEDIFFQIKFLYQCKSIGYIDSCYYYYCENESSLSQSHRKDRFEMSKLLHEEIINLLTILYPENIRSVSLSVDRLFLGYFRNMCLNYNYNLSDFRIFFSDSYLIDIINRYPYKDLPIKYRFFILLIKYKLSIVVLLLNKII